MIILTLNSRSSSIDYYLFNYPNPVPLTTGSITGIGYRKSQLPGQSVRRVIKNHAEALSVILRRLSDPHYGVIKSRQKIAAVGHRIVHGGEFYRSAVKIDPQVLQRIRICERFAPKYNRPGRQTAVAAMQQLSHCPHMAIFDTAFHSTIPAKAYTYPLPYDWYETHRVRRYGFHGSSHFYLSRRAAVQLGKPVEQCDLITIHLDLGISVCAIKNGQSVDISTGMTPVEGTAQERRSGNIDPGIPGFMMDWQELSAQQIEEVLNEKSGLCGIVGDNLSRKEVLQRAQAGDERALLAATIESYRLRKIIGEYLCALGGCDAIVFSAGQGAIESWVRENVLAGMECFGIQLDLQRNVDAAHPHEMLISSNQSSIAVYMIPTDEARVICEETALLVQNNGKKRRGFTFS